MLAHIFDLKSSKSLLDWYAARRRYYPWSDASSAYQIWLSEVMLQQTTVQAVIPYFEKWVQRWPDAFAVAQSLEEEILRAWEGLGYYRRARSFYRACLQLYKDNYRHPPAAYNYLISLPGIGDYTARAILSFAYHLNYAVFDTNVLRICQRLSALQRVDNTTLKGWKQVLHEQLHNQSALWNSAIMQLGQQVCRPQNPRCQECPWQTICCAYAQGKSNSIPEKRQKKIIKTQFHTALIIDPEKKLLVLRKTTGALANLWRLPSWEESEANPYNELLAGRQLLEGEKSLSLEEQVSNEDENRWGRWLLKEQKHFYVNRCDHLKPRLYLLDRKKEPPKDHYWYSLDELAQLVMPSSYRRIIDELCLQLGKFF